MTRILPSSPDPFVGLPVAILHENRDADGRVYQWALDSSGDGPYLYLVVTRIRPTGGQPRGGRLRYEIEAGAGRPNSRARMYYETSWADVRDRLTGLVRAAEARADLACPHCDTDHRDADGDLVPCLDSIAATMATGEIMRKGAL